MRLGLVLLLTAVANAAVRYKFDFDWKFKLGNVANEDLCPPTAFPTNLDGWFCPGWAHQAAYDLTETECQLYCCGDPTCAGYIYNNGYCAVGNSLDGCYNDPSQKYVGGGRPLPGPIVQTPNGPLSVGYDDSSWDNVSLPHDFIVLQPPTPSGEWNHGYRPKNISWYRKEFVLNASFVGQAIYLEFEGVYRASDMWLNGQLLGHHSSGYTPCIYRIDNVPSIRIGAVNTLAVRVDPRANEGWWYEGGGLYRHAWLVATNMVHAPIMGGVYVPSRVISPITPALTADALADVYTDVLNHGATAATFAVKWAIASPGGGAVWNATSSTVVLAPGATTTVFQQALLPAAPLWHTTSPSMHVLTTQILIAGNVVDETETFFGVRKLFFDPNYGFFLNDQNVKVTGMCNHQDFAGVGTAVPDRIEKYRISSLQEFGVNGWRSAHNPPNVALLDWADRLGLLVWDENRMFGDFAQWYIDQRDMILRDRNHPSVIWWSLCNEWGCEQFDMNTTVSVGVKFREIIKELDPSRPISGAWNGAVQDVITWGNTVVDIAGINYNYQEYDQFHAASPTQALISSESCSCTSDRSYYVNASDAIIGTFHAWQCISDCWQPVATRPFVMGSFDWTGHDYRGEETPTVWPSINSHFGMLDLAAMPKDDAYFFRANFLTDEPLAHITPQFWNYQGMTPTENGTILTSDCQGALSQQWKFTPGAAAGSTIESMFKPGQCLKFGTVYPAFTVPCAEADLFFTDQYGEIYIESGGQKYCLDVYVAQGPWIGFYACKEAADTNQDWTYTSTNEIRSTDANDDLTGVCVNYVDGSQAQVWVYTNGDSVELLLNGKSIGLQSVPQFGKAGFFVTFAPGNLTAVATKGGKPWAVDMVQTTGAATHLTLEVTVPTTAGEHIVADGQDVTLVTASVVDANGLVVRNVSPMLTFHVVSGPGTVKGTGNGDPSDHTPDQGPLRAAWNGFARAIIQASTMPGTIEIMVTSPGLGMATVTVVADAPHVPPRIV